MQPGEIKFDRRVEIGIFQSFKGSFVAYRKARRDC